MRQNDRTIGADRVLGISTSGEGTMEKSGDRSTTANTEPAIELTEASSETLLAPGQYNLLTGELEPFPKGPAAAGRSLAV